MRVTLIKATAFLQRNPDRAEVFRTGVIHNRAWLLATRYRSRFRQSKARFAKISAERQPSDNSGRNHSRDLSPIPDHLAMKVPLRLDRRILIARHAIFCSKQVLWAETGVHVEQVVERSDQ